MRGNFVEVELNIIYGTNVNEKLLIVINYITT